MNNADAPRRRLRWWHWLLGFLAASFLIVVCTVVDTITLNREARAVRCAAFAALEDRPVTQVELSAGATLLGAARSCLWFVDRVPPEARLALKAVRSASVGVYRLRRAPSAGERTKLLTEIEAALNHRGWARTVGVIEGRDTVMVYTRDDGWFSAQQKVCAVVCEPSQLVIVAATADPAPLLELAKQHAVLASAY